MISGPMVVVAAWLEDLFRKDVNTRILRDKNQVRTKTQPGTAGRPVVLRFVKRPGAEQSFGGHKLQPCNFGRYRAYFPVLCRPRFGPSFEKTG